MRDFFHHQTWPRPDGALHLYVLPEADEARDRFVAAQRRLAGIDHLPPQPPPYLHCTLQRLGVFDHDISQPWLTRLGTTLADGLGGLEPFSLHFDRPVVRETAVECPAAPSPAWDGLVAATRRAIAEVHDGELPTAPHGPHLTLAYATGNVDDDLVASRLADVAPLGDLLVARVHLVSVTVRPELGIFDFTELATQDLDG